MRMKPSLTSSDVKRMMAASLAEAEKNKWQVTVAIVDDGGFMLALDRMDGAAVTTAEVAVGKARTAALTRRPSKFFEDRVKERPGFLVFPPASSSRARCRSCTRRSASARSASPASSRSRTSRLPAPASPDWASSAVCSVPRQGSAEPHEKC